MRFSIVIALIVFFSITCGLSVQAQDKSPSPSFQDPAARGIRSALQNPVRDMYSLRFKFSFDYGADDGEASVFNIIPVVPITKRDWSFIHRFNIPMADSPGLVTGLPGIPNPIPGPGATGFGDINYSLLFSPVESNIFIWGVGPSIALPTATDEQLGSEKWSAGPIAMVVSLPQWGAYGLFARHLWSFAGNSDRTHVNQSLFEPLLFYNLPNRWYLMTDMIIVANWQADVANRWTVPLGGGFGKALKIGNQALSVRTEAYYNVVAPKSAPEWSWGFSIQFLLHKRSAHE